MKKAILGMSLLALVSGCKDIRPLEKEIALSFSDSALTKFQQISASSSPISPDTIECLTGEKVKFEVEAFNESLSLTLECSSDIDKKIRQSLIKLMASKTIILESLDGSSILASGITIDLDTKEQLSKSYNNITAVVPLANCKDRHNINVASGVWILESDSANNSGIEQDCLDAYAPGASANDYRQSYSFSFLEGKIELKNVKDSNKTLTFCIKDAGNNQCLAL